MKEKNNLLTEGVIWKKLLWFAVPILMGNLLQQFYNTVDSIVVGNYVGSDALAAVGASAPLINLLIGFFTGVATGAGVVVSRYCGAKNDEELSLSVHTTIAFTIISSIAMTFIGVFFAPTILTWMGTPSEILADASVYLRIYFVGIITNMLYNSAAGILRAVGDSKRPLIFLIISVLLNIVLDLLFVVEFKMGVAGVAWATIICQTVSTILVLSTLMRTKSAYRLRLSKIRIHWDMLEKIVRVGIPAGLQQVVISFSNVMVQTYVNSFGSVVIAGFSSGNKVDNILAMITSSASLSITTFVSQNIGAKRIDRVKEGVKVCLIMTVLVIIATSIPLFIYAEQCIRLFVVDDAVIYYGALMMRYLIPFYVFLTYSNIYVGVLRGAGYAKGPMIIQIINLCVFRLIFLHFAMKTNYSIKTVYLSYAFTWVTSCISITFYTQKSKWLQNAIHLV